MACLVDDFNQPHMVATGNIGSFSPKESLRIEEFSPDFLAFRADFREQPLFSRKIKDCMIYENIFERGRQFSY